MTSRQTNTGAIVSKNSKHDDFILTHYHKPDWNAAKIGAHLGIPRGSVITRYRIITGHAQSKAKLAELALSSQPSLPKLSFLEDK